MELFRIGDVVKNEAVQDMLLAIGTQAEMTDGSAQLPVKVPVFAVFCAMKVKKILQHLRCSDQFGIELFRKYIIRCLRIGKIDAAFQIIARKNFDLLGE
jgi:hypothetical protein